MLKSIKARYYMPLLQIVVLLSVIAAVLLFYRQPLSQFFNSTQAGKMGLILNGLIVVIFLIGLARMMVMFQLYNNEQSALERFVKKAQENAPNPTYGVNTASLIAERYHAIQVIHQQKAPINQAALAATLVANQHADFTLVKYVNSILILAGVLGTVISLAVALMGAAGLMNSTENMKNMWDIIGGMSNSLSTTVTSIILYVFFAYFYLRLQDARTQMLANVEDVTSMYIMPRFKMIESSLSENVAKLASDLKLAAELINQVQSRYLQAGEQLQLAASDLQRAVANSGDNIRIIRDSIREGFRLEAREQKA